MRGCWSSTTGKRSRKTIFASGGGTSIDRVCESALGAIQVIRCHTRAFVYCAPCAVHAPCSGGIYTLNRGGRPPFSRCAAHVAGALGPHTHMIHHALTMFAHTHAFAHTRRSRCQPTCRRMLAVPSLVPSSSSTCAHAHTTRSVYVHIIRSAPSRLCVSKLVTVTHWHPRRRGWLSCGSPGEAGTHSTLITTAPTLWCTMHASRSGRDVEMATASIHLPPSHRQPPHHHQQPNDHNPPNTSTPRVCVWS